MTYLEKLVKKYGGDAPGNRSEIPDPFPTWPSFDTTLLEKMLRMKNGFYAFRAALHVFPIGNASLPQELLRWNSEPWKKAYLDDKGAFLCFAENAFGEPFCLSSEGIFRLDPETGEREMIGTDLETWAKAMIEDPDYQLASGLALQWQKANGALPPGRRLAPKKPFVLGGAFDVENLYSADPIEAMDFRADLYGQIKDLPDGASIQIEIVP